MVVAAPTRPRGTRWWWIRHAPVAAPPGLILPRDTSAELTIPVEKALATLRRRLPEPAIHLTSDVPRAAMTAAKLSHVPAQWRGDLAEQEFGDWTGKTHDALWQSGDALYRTFLDQPDTTRPPAGESFADLCARVAAAIAEIGVLYEGMDLVVVAHAGTIRAALAVALDLSPAHALRFAVDHLSLTRIEAFAGAWRVATVNRSP